LPGAAQLYAVVDRAYLFGVWVSHSYNCTR
jgi:hypothetical protein